MIPTAEEYLARMKKMDMPTSEIMKGFAKRHCEEQAKVISEQVILEKASDYGTFNEETADFKYKGGKSSVQYHHGHGESGYTAIRTSTESILNAYSLENIK